MNPRTDEIDRLDEANRMQEIGSLLYEMNEIDEINNEVDLDDIFLQQETDNNLDNSHDMRGHKFIPYSEEQDLQSLAILRRFKCEYKFFFLNNKILSI